MFGCSELAENKYQWEKKKIILASDRTTGTFTSLYRWMMKQPTTQRMSSRTYITRPKKIIGLYTDI